MAESEKTAITCQICDTECHVIKVHLKKDHPEITVEQYQEQYPHSPLMSNFAERRFREKMDKRDHLAALKPSAKTSGKVDMHKLFELGDVPAAMSRRGKPISVSVFDCPKEHQHLIPEIDPGYIFSIELLKTALMGVELNIPTHLWGHAGTGKTTMWEQICAYTQRPFYRVQHTVNTEEASILGQWTAIGGETQFSLGPLPNAMTNGWLYCADEYDFAMPHVLGVYQPVLEGKPLVIKEANMTVKPHPEFRFVATGNTNGSGDETGLYQGTQIQNAANFERFGIVNKVEYMSPDLEEGVLLKTGITKNFAGNLVEFANAIRGSYERRDITAPISTRALLNAASLGMRRGSLRFGVRVSFINRLGETSAKIAEDLLQRYVGE